MVLADRRKFSMQSCGTACRVFVSRPSDLVGAIPISGITFVLPMFRAGPGMEAFLWMGPDIQTTTRTVGKG